MSQPSESNETAIGEPEAGELANQLADQYIDYLSIDIDQQRGQVNDSIEELLTHLEEVNSVLENYRAKSADLESVPALIASKRSSLEELFSQIDKLEQYISETDKVLNQLDARIKEYESQKRSDTNPLLQVMELIPRLSLGVRSIWSRD